MVGSKLTEEIMQLPIDFINRMKTKLGEEYEAFLRSYEEERAYGLRYNPLKISRENFEKVVPAITDKVKWAKEG